MARTIIPYAVALALGVFVLEWLQYRYITHAFSTEIYICLIAIGFTGVGVWFGKRLTHRRIDPAASYPPSPAFQRNEAAATALGLTARECEILELLASGKSMKELGRQLGVSPNTVKTHVSRVYQKLDVRRRMNAVEKARALSIIT